MSMLSLDHCSIYLFNMLYFPFLPDVSQYTVSKVMLFFVKITKMWSKLELLRPKQMLHAQLTQWLEDTVLRPLTAAKVGAHEWPTIRTAVEITLTSCSLHNPVARAPLWELLRTRCCWGINQFTASAPTATNFQGIVPIVVHNLYNLEVPKVGNTACGCELEQIRRAVVASTVQLGGLNKNNEKWKYKVVNYEIREFFKFYFNHYNCYYSKYQQ